MSVRISTVVVAVLSLVAATTAILHAVPLSIVLSAAALAPMLTEHLPDRLDARAGENIQIVEEEAACQYLQRLAALHIYLVQAAATNDSYQVRRAAEIGRHQMWDATTLLINQGTRAASEQLVARERLLVQLAHLVDNVAYDSRLHES